MLEGSTPGLALLTNPIPPDQAPPDRPLVYAPVALSGLAIAFKVEHQPGDALGMAPLPDTLRAQTADSMRMPSMPDPRHLHAPRQ
ncbi:MAG: hypothetical protein ACRDRP_11840 [Pseudonocardiaceae bacterium]